MSEVLVCSEGELADGDVRIVCSGTLEVGVFRHEGQYRAYRNLCPHQGGPACEGIRLPKVVSVIAPDKTFHGQRYDESKMHFVCPWHGYEYKLDTGECVGNPRLRLRSYPVSERDGRIYVTL
jgi:nitrite reductase (NADH) small subunit